MSFPRIWSSWLGHVWFIYSLFLCHTIYSLYYGHITIYILELDCLPSKFIYKCHKWWPYWIYVPWAIFSAPIDSGMYRVGTLCRRLMEFLTHGYSETSLPDMLEVEWYYGDSVLDHNDPYTCVLTQLPQKSCTAKKSLSWLWHHLWQGRLELNTILPYIKMIKMKGSKWPGTTLLVSIDYFYI